MAKRFIPALYWSIGLLVQGTSIAALAAPEEVEPHYYSRLLQLGQPYLIFDTPQSAWAHYKPIRQAQMIKDSGPNGHPDLLQDLFNGPAPYDVLSINGFPSYYGWHYLRWENTPNGSAYVQKWTGSMTLSAECPVGTQSINGYLGNSQYTLTCRIPEIAYPTCPAVGNPVYAATGRKQQNGPDYFSPSQT